MGNICGKKDNIVIGATPINTNQNIIKPIKWYTIYITNIGKNPPTDKKWLADINNEINVGFDRQTFYINLESKSYPTSIDELSSLVSQIDLYSIKCGNIYNICNYNNKWFMLRSEIDTNKFEN